MTDDTYDYVIVGAGSAGAVLAARLSEDAATTVLLLEAGGEAEADEISIPAAFPALFKTKWDWNYSTTEQKQLEGRRAYWPRMKALGGCSSMNAMIYIRGNHADYDAWRDQHGATGWGHDDVLPYFVRSEGNTRLGGPLHGQDGPLHVEDRAYTHDLSHAFVRSAVSAGHKPTDDFNGAEQEGAGLYQVTCKKGRRWSTNDAYLAPARARRNLTVATGAFATGLELSGERCSGVRFRQAGTEHVVHARHEVLLAGGAVNSPQLLMLSGIGPGAHLAEVGIDSRVELPGVGSNLQDHPVVPMLWYTRGTTDLAQLNNLRNFARWKARGTGPLSSNVGEAGAFFASRDGPRRARHPDPRGAVGLLRQRAARADQPDVHRRARPWSRCRAGARCGCAPPTRPGTRPSTRRTSRTRPTSTRCSPGPGSPGTSAARASSPGCSTGPGGCRPTRPTTTCSSTSGTGRRRSTTPSRPARWAPATTPSSTPPCGCAASTGSGSSTPR